jgi:hypothetical protein
MLTTDKSRIRSGPNDKHYVNPGEDHGVKYENKRMQAARKFGESKGNA